MFTWLNQFNLRLVHKASLMLRDQRLREQTQRAEMAEGSLVAVRLLLGRAEGSLEQAQEAVDRLMQLSATKARASELQVENDKLLAANAKLLADLEHTQKTVARQNREILRLEDELRIARVPSRRQP